MDMERAALQEQLVAVQLENNMVREIETRERERERERDMVRQVETW